MSRKRRKLPKKVVSCLWLLAAVFLAFTLVKLRPLLLISAAQSGNVPLARLALSVGTSPNTMTFGDGIGRPVLVVFAIERHPDMVKLLLDAGADPNKGDGAMPPLVAAAIGGNADCIHQLLLHGANPNGHYKDGTSVLDSLSSPQDPVIVAMLKHAGAKE